MYETIIKDYNKLLNYVGEKCVYKNPKTGKEQSFKKLNYESYLKLSKNKAKKKIFNEKLKELMKKDISFKMLIRNFNGKHSNKVGFIDNINTFFQIGETVSRQSRVVEYISGSTSNSKESNKSKFKGISNFFKKMPDTLKSANIISMGALAGLAILGSPPSLMIIASFIPVGTTIYYGGKKIVSLIKGNKANKSNRNDSESGEVENNNEAQLEMDNQREVEMQPLPDLNNDENLTQQPLPSVEENEDVVLPNAKYSQAARFNEPRVFRPKNSAIKPAEVKPQENEDEVDNSIELPNQTEDNDRTDSSNVDAEVIKGRHVRKDNGPKDETETEKVVGKHTKKDKFEFIKKQTQGIYEKYLTGYGETIREFAKKYLVLLEKTQTSDEVKELNLNFKKNLNDVLHSEIKHQNFRNDLMGNSERKEALEIKTDSRNMINKYQSELNSINKDKLEVQKEYLESIKENNLENNYVKSLCEIVIGKIDEYEKMKSELSEMDSSTSEYLVKKEEVEKMYNKVYMYAFSVDGVIKKEISKETKGK